MSIVWLTSIYYPTITRKFLDSLRSFKKFDKLIWLAYRHYVQSPFSPISSQSVTCSLPEGFHNSEMMTLLHLSGTILVSETEQLGLSGWIMLLEWSSYFSTHLSSTWGCIAFVHHHGFRPLLHTDTWVLFQGRGFLSLSIPPPYQSCVPDTCTYAYPYPFNATSFFSSQLLSGFFVFKLSQSEKLKLCPYFKWYCCRCIKCLEKHTQAH